MRWFDFQCRQIAYKILNNDPTINSNMKTCSNIEIVAY